MAVEDFLESEVAVAVAVTAAVLSPRVRGVMRRGLVYGVAGVLKAGDALSSAVQSAAMATQSTTDATGIDSSAGPRQSTLAVEAGSHRWKVTDELLVAGVEAFTTSFENLNRIIHEKWPDEYLKRWTAT